MQNSSDADNNVTNLQKVCNKGKKWLEYEYVDKNRTCTSIAKELNVYAIDVSLALKKFDIPARSSCGKDKKCIEEYIKLLNNYDWLYEAYVTNKYSITHISKKLLHISAKKIKNQLAYFDIPIRSYSDQLSITRKKIWNTPEKKFFSSMKFKKLWHEDSTFIEKMKNREYPKGSQHKNYGRKWTDDRKKSLIGRKSRLLKPGVNTYKSIGCWYYKNDLKIWLRSTYELRVAIILDSLGIEWEYENKTFDIPNSYTTYTPDFYLPEFDVWWEVKGWFREEAKQKMIKLLSHDKNIHLKIIFEKDIKELEKILDFDIYKLLELGSDIGDC